MKSFPLILCALCILVIVAAAASADDPLSPDVTPTQPEGMAYREVYQPTQTQPEGMAYREQIGGSFGYFSIGSSPSGADVVFDGSFQGETPLMVEVYTTATPYHTVSISRYGYQTWTTTLNRNPAPGGTIPVYATLQPDVQTGSIYVSSSPSGAIARLDGGQTLKTPGSFSNVPTGYHTVEVSMAGYYPYSTSVSVSAGGTSSVSASLSPQQTSGSLRISSNPSGAEAFVDDIYRGYTPLSVGALSTGQHSVRLRLSGYQTYSTNVNIQSGRESVISATLSPVYQPTTGDIMVSSVPDGAEIYLDGNYQGLTFQGNPYDITGVAPGTHTVGLLKAGYQDYSTSVGVIAGGIATVSAALTAGSSPSATGSMTIQSSPSGADVYLDNVYEGFSPLTLDDVTTGSHVVAFKLTGYTDAQYTIQVGAGQSVQVLGTLSPVPTTQPTKGPLSLSVVAGAFVMLMALGWFRRN
jgi:hypothetical protein